MAPATIGTGNNVEAQLLRPAAKMRCGVGGLDISFQMLKDGPTRHAQSICTTQVLPGYRRFQTCTAKIGKAWVKDLRALYVKGDRWSGTCRDLLPNTKRSEK